MQKWAWWVFFRVLLVLLGLAWQAWGQSADIRGQMEEVLRYTGLAKPASDDVARMAELWTRAQQPGLAKEERRLAFRDLYLLYAKLHGRDLSSRPQALDGMAQFALTTFEGGGRMDLRLPEPRGKPAGRYLHLETAGNGTAPMLLISDLGVDGRRLYASFVQRQARAYRMQIVTLPYAGAARPLPWPERLDYATRPWLSQIEQELLALVDRPEMKDVVVVGTSAGGYFAARLALLRPKQVRAVLLVDSLVAMPLRSVSDPDAPAPPAERLQRLRAVSPTPQLFPVAPIPPGDELRRLIADPNSTHPTARNWMAFAVKDVALSRTMTFDALAGGFFVPSLEYRWEFLTTDLTEQMKSLTVPMLAMGAIHDEGSPSQSPPSLSQWEELRLLYPHIPLTVVAFADSRAYINENCPQEFDHALADFLAGRPVRGKASYSLPRTSPRAEVMQDVAGAEVRIAYGRPAVKDREIWGKLVPYNRVWRAGANEATTFATNHDVVIEGHALPAGTYTFFVIPIDGDWTVIFNRVPRQWGAFNYNPAFDALRFQSKPSEGAHEEWLNYRIETETKDTALVTLAWAGKRLSFRVAIPQTIGSATP